MSKSLTDEMIDKHPIITAFILLFILYIVIVIICRIFGWALPFGHGGNPQESYQEYEEEY